MTTTPFERVGIMGLTYVIGFTTAFIAFGLDEGAVKDELVAYKETSAEVVKENMGKVKGVAAVSNQAGLYALVDGERRMLSANRNSLLELAESEVLNGAYYDLGFVSISPNNNFIYFCEQIEANSGECHPFIYDIKNDVLHRVAVGSVTVQADSVVAWQEDGRLMVGEFVSATSEQPWK